MEIPHYCVMNADKHAVGSTKLSEPDGWGRVGRETQDDQKCLKILIIIFTWKISLRKVF